MTKCGVKDFIGNSMIGSWQLPTPFSISSKPKFLGVKGVTDFIGILMAVGSFILGPFIIRLEMQLPPLSLGKEFGKLRFLKEWLFLCGQQPMVKF